MAADADVPMEPIRIEEAVTSLFIASVRRLEGNLELGKG
jgi:hypothetical protein